jgi:hypothetical protein
MRRILWSRGPFELQERAQSSALMPRAGHVALDTLHRAARDVAAMRFQLRDAMPTRT